MAFTYWLPDDIGNKKELTTDNNAIIIIGANGSGKSKLGAWIEQQSWSEVHRVGAQRNLNFSENLQLKSFREAEHQVFYGNPDQQNNDKGSRWSWGHYTTMLLNDFDYVLAALLALSNNDNRRFVKLYKESVQNGTSKPAVPETAIDKLISIWSEILPERRLIEDDSKFHAEYEQDGQLIKYSATEMSDGERAVLYLAAQVLGVLQNKILIIDEPEVHLHRSIMNRLWRKLEQYRPDCLFIYITHDVQFAASHENAEKYWIKEYDGHRWIFQKITEDSLPEEMLLEICGNRKNVLFVEGDKHSYDTQLYIHLYPDYLIVPCGGCSQVIARTKAFRACSMLHDYKIYGLIDRDYRSEHEIQSYKSDNIYVLGVAEVENLFLVEELVKIVAVQFGEDPNTSFDKVKDFVVNKKFSNMINRQICQSVVAEIKYQISCIEIAKSSEVDAKTSLQNGLDAIDYDELKNQKEAVFLKAKNSNDYKEVLRVFNEKGVSSSVGRFLGINNHEYKTKVLRLLNGVLHDEIVNALVPYLPTEIPR